MYLADSKRLMLAGAKKMMVTAVAMAEEAGIAISVAIVDAGGHVILVERMDGGRFHTVHSATTKAVCAASNKRRPPRRGAGATARYGTCNRTRARCRCRPVDRHGGRFPHPRRWRMHRRVGVSGGNFEFDERVARAAVASIGAK
jgi:uncharacterized protein GlcG (DUF336 family)